ncbi:putative Shugoshin [Triangularia verruculosa]|uniref:Shugoshin n=1 Tax=Triangularia verruculosa TaxID=2587418 RepID=A0AAN6XBF1_9PEZI|nr:putative Shugoshin [Triangularia verruculosa]
MARLNEPPLSAADSNLEILRRKFLRQNRDIARINSDQSQKIRRLENDCACLLSENLELRGQILRLEKQLEDNSARRIADHALEIKAKLEAQLAEFGALLGNLGVEPPAKRHSGADRRFSKSSRPSTSRTPPAIRRRRDTNVDAETLAFQEGRMPPIYENKSYQRATMNSEEIMALCAAAADTSADSLDLGPPPVSRFIDEEPVKKSSPTRKAEDGQLNLSSPPKLDFTKRLPASPEPSKILEASPTKDIQPEVRPPPIEQPPPTPPTQTIRAGAKRKYGDENSVQATLDQTAKELKDVVAAEKALPSRDILLKRRSIKELPASKRDKMRAPLAAKSTNEDFMSPKKMAAKSKPIEEPKKENAPPPKELPAKEQPKARKLAPATIQVPPVVLPPPTVLSVIAEPDAPLPMSILTSPTTPGRPSSVEPLPHDTPPPAHISSEGETSRPSRRARPAISYAEPNLRDKMRRPTKELFDAVSGEGKFHRPSTTANPNPTSAPTSTAKPRSESAVTSSGGLSASAHKPPPPTSPLAAKEPLPIENITYDRRKRPSLAIREQSEPQPELEIDPYDFASTSSSTLSLASPPPQPRRAARKSSMAAQAALHKLQLEEERDADGEGSGGGSRPMRARKARASMLAPKKSAFLGEYAEESSVSSSTVGDESTGSVESNSGKAKGKGTVDGRRSMML